MSLSTDLQAAISQLQSDHSDLVTAVRARNGVSGSTNTAIAGKLAGDVTIQAKADALRSAVALPSTESLSLDFINDLYQTGLSSGGGLNKGMKFSDLITLTRSSVGSRWARDGKIEYVAANLPRFEHDPLTGVLKGLLIEESRTNTCPYSTAINRGGWVTSGAWFGPNDSLAPDGSYTGLRLIEDNSNNEHRIYISSTPVAAATAYTGSIWVKAGTRRYVYLHFSQINVWGTDSTMSAKFDIQTGTVIAVGAAVTAKVEPAPNGWFRISITSTATSATATSGLAIGMCDDALATLGRDFYLGSGFNYISVWGPQFEQGAFPTSYIPASDTFTSRAGTATYTDANGFVQSAATNVARSNAYTYDQDGGLRSIGLLVEGPATNMHLYSQLFTDASWIKTAGTIAVNSTSPVGVSNKFIPDTSAVAHFLQKNFTGALGTVYTSWRVMKAGEYTKVRAQLYATPLFGAVDFDLSNGTITGNSSGLASIKPMGSGWYLCSITGVCSVDGNVADRWYPLDTDGITSSFAGDGVKGYFVCAAQLETGPVATSYIPTTSAQVTRGSDVVSTAQSVRARDLAFISTLSPWFNQSQGSVFVDFTPGAIGVGNTNAALYMGGPSLTNDYVIIRRGTGATGIYGLLGSANGANQATMLGSSAGATGVATKAAMAWKFNDAAFIATGGTLQTDNSIILPAPTQMFIGNGSSQQFLNGTLRSVKYFPRRITNAELQALTV